MTSKILVKEKNTLNEVQNHHTYSEVWVDVKLSHFMVEEELDNFSGEVRGCS